MLKEISVRRLREGMYVSLRDVPWFKHPFLISSFEITRQSEIRDIMALGRETILYDPDKSTTKPLQKDSRIKVSPHGGDFTSKSLLKNEKASELRRRRQRFQVMERSFNEAVGRAEIVLQGVGTGQINLCEEAKTVAAEMAQTFLEDVTLSVQHISASAADEGQHFHMLNVMILSMMLGKQLELDRDQMETLGFGALVHDIGFLQLPKKIVHNPKLKKLELERFREHPKLGVAMLSRLPDIDRNVMKIVYQHHEEYDGSGYPKGLHAKDIHSLSSIVAVVDMYDRMINTRDPSLALSPHKALAYMYGRKKASFDENVLSVFIKMLGVYPPGTVCRFSSGDVGVVLDVDPKDPLHPEIIIYDPSIPKYDAMIYKLGVDLDMQIDDILSPKDLDVAALNYLDARSSIQYYPSVKS